MSKRAVARTAQKERSAKHTTAVWIGAVLSAALLYVAAAAVMASVKALRSCDTNSTGLSASSCGKQGLNEGDLVLFGLLILAAALFVSMATAAARTVRRAKA